MSSAPTLSTVCLDFYKIKGSYAEGTQHTVVVKCTDAEENVTYSVPEYKGMFSEYLPVKQGTAKTLTFQENLTGNIPSASCLADSFPPGRFPLRRHGERTARGLHISTFQEMQSYRRLSVSRK